MPRRRFAGPLLAGLLLAGLLVRPALCAQVLTPALLPPDRALSNPLSGLYAGYYQNPRTLAAEPSGNGAPWPAAALERYARFSWHSLELAGPGQYNFAPIDAMLAALPKGVRLGFRIMAFNPQTASDTNVTTGTDGYPVYADLPADLETGAHGWLLPVDPNDATQGRYFIPDWNDPVVLARISRLLAALGARYDGDPRFAWIDVGLYGSWGEWHTAGLPDSADYRNGIPYRPGDAYYALNQQAYRANKGVAGAYQAGSVASKDAIVDAHLEAFPRTRLAMLTDDGDALCHALEQPGSTAHVGLRRDSLGSSVNGFYWQFPNALPDCMTGPDLALILDRWRTAPFVVEAFGNGSSPTFPCQSFEQYLPADRSHAYNCSVSRWDGTVPNYCIDEEVLATHVADIKNASLCHVPWTGLGKAERHAFTDAALAAGYRLAPARVEVAEAAGSLTLRTGWLNQGVTPTYDDWKVVLSLWSGGRRVAQWSSALDLRRVLPTGTTPLTATDRLPLPPGLKPGRYSLRVAVVDRQGYLAPMALALAGAVADGGYTLGSVTLGAG